MKKKLNILVLASAFAMLGLTACNNTPNSSESQEASSSATTTSSSNGESSSADICALTDEIRDIAQKAYAAATTAYNSWSSTGITGDQDLTTTVKKKNSEGTKEYTFTFVYSVDEAYASNLAISEDGTKLIVTLPNSLKGEEDFKGKVGVKVFLEGCSEVAYSDSVNVIVKASAIYDLETIYSLDAEGKKVVASDTTVTFNAVYMGMYPQQGAMLGDGEYAIIAYKLTSLDSDIAVGDALSVSGKISDYSGLRELTNVTVSKLSTRPASLKDPVAIELEGESARALKWGDDSRKITVKGAKVTSTYVSSTNGNTTIYTTLNGHSYPVFLNSTYSADVLPSWKRTRSGAEEATLVEAGDIVSFSGYVSAYNNVYQAVYAELTSWEEAPITVNAPSQLFVNETGTITATLKGGVTPTTVTFTSSDSEVVSVTDEGKVTGLKTGEATITVTATGTVDGEEFTATDTVAITVAKITPTETTIGALLAKADSSTTSYVWDQTTIYSVTGIIEGLAGDQYGNSYLTDKTTGESIKVYGLSGNENKGFTYTDGKWSYSNPKDATDSLKDVHNGEEVTLNVMFEDAKGTANIVGSVISHEAKDYTYASTITVGENGTASLSTNDPVAYGTKVTVTATPSEGYIVDTVKVTTAYGSKTLEAAEDGTYSYEVTCKNEVSVTFAEKPSGDVQTVKLSASDFTAADAAKNITQTVKGFTVALSLSSANAGLIDANAIRVYQNATFALSTELGTITKAVFTCTANGTTKEGPGCFTGDNYTAGTDKVGTWESAAGAASFTLNATKQVRIASIDITYVAKAAA